MGRFLAAQVNRSLLTSQSQSTSLLLSLPSSEISAETPNEFCGTLHQANKNDPYLLILGSSFGDFLPCLPHFPIRRTQRQILQFLNIEMFKGTLFLLIHPPVLQGEPIESFIYLLNHYFTQFAGKVVESQTQRMVWVERAPKDPLIPIPCQGQGHLFTRPGFPVQGLLENRVIILGSEMAKEKGNYFSVSRDA